MKHESEDIRIRLVEITWAPVRGVNGAYATIWTCDKSSGHWLVKLTPEEKACLQRKYRY